MCDLVPSAHRLNALCPLVVQKEAEAKAAAEEQARKEAAAAAKKKQEEEAARIKAEVVNQRREAFCRSSWYIDY